MKKIIVLFSVLTVLACKEEVKNFVTLSGKIDNVNEQKKLIIQNRSGFNREIAINDDGTFNDTLNVTEGNYFFFDGNEFGQLYLKNNNTTVFNFDAQQLDETLIFTGDAADKNNFYVANIRLQKKHLSQDIMSKSKTEFDDTFDAFKKEYTELKERYKNLDSIFYSKSDEEFEALYKRFKTYYDSKLALLNSLPAGSPSPIFEAYENYDGSKTSLKDLKGKYVYVDVWATWCGPCKAEIPSLKKLESDYHGKNIQFLSISIDDDRSHGGSWDKAKENWKAMISEKELSGIQLFAPNGWQSQFILDYKIQGIPRFLLIDPNGHIVTPDAPRPSSPKLIELFDTLPI